MERCGEVAGFGLTRARQVRSYSRMRMHGIYCKRELVGGVTPTWMSSKSCARVEEEEEEFGGNTAGVDE